MVEDRRNLSLKYIDEISPLLTIMDSVGTSVEEVDEYAKLNKPDIMFCDQLDKFRISGEFNRGDERLKETYVYAREIAKRNKLLMWAVSQASYDAHDRQWIDYSMLDNSRTGKAGEADIIIGIGKTGSSEVENTVRHICISKNKLNGWHGMINAQIDIDSGVLLMAKHGDVREDGMVFWGSLVSTQIGEVQINFMLPKREITITRHV